MGLLFIRLVWIFGFLGFLGRVERLACVYLCGDVVVLFCVCRLATWVVGLLLICFLVFCWYLLMWGFCVLLVVYIWLLGLGMFGGACCIAALVGCLLGLLVDCWF